MSSIFNNKLTLLAHHATGMKAVADSGNVLTKTQLLNAANELDTCWDAFHRLYYTVVRLATPSETGHEEALKDLLKALEDVDGSKGYWTEEKQS